MRDPDDDRDDDRWREGKCARCGRLTEDLSASAGMCGACDPGHGPAVPLPEWVKDVIRELTIDFTFAHLVENMRKGKWPAHDELVVKQSEWASMALAHMKAEAALKVIAGMSGREAEQAAAEVARGGLKAAKASPSMADLGASAGVDQDRFAESEHGMVYETLDLPIALLHLDLSPDHLRAIGNWQSSQHIQVRRPL